MLGKNTPMRIIILLIFTIVFTSQLFNQDLWKDYCGNYHPCFENIDDGDLWYFSLEPGTGWKYLDTADCGVRWFSKDSLQNDLTIECKMSYVYLQNDSLIFRTKTCFNEQIIFQGRFTMPANQFPIHEWEPILEGRLLLLRNGIVQKKLTLTFMYSDLGD
jgi:hypothetical protein